MSKFAKEMNENKMLVEVNKILMDGFKNNEDLAEFDLGPHTKVIGANGKGKTTIGEAIAWVMLGADLAGNERAATRLLNEKSKNMYVEIGFTFGGEEHTLIRRRGSTTSIILDDKNVKQSDLVNFYYSKELFLSIFNPTYFPSLTPKDAKAVLESVLEEVKKEDVYGELSERIVNTLRKTGFGNPNLYMENQRERLKEIKEEMQYWDGYKEGTQEVIEIPEEIKFDDKPLKELKKQLEEVNKLEVAQLHDIGDLLNIREELQIKANKVKSQIETLEFSSAKLVDTTKLSLKVNSLRNNYKDKQSLIKDLNNTISCPKCETVIDLDNDTKVKVLAELEVLKDEGLKAAKELDRVKTSNAKLEVEHEEQAQEKYKELHQELAKLEMQIESLNIKKLQEENQASIKEQEDVIEAQRSKVTAEINLLEEDQRTIGYHNKTREDLIKRKEEMQSKVKEAIKCIAELAEEEKQVKIYIDYAKQFASKKLEIQAKQISKHLDKVTIQLERIVESTGELKPDFKILYDGKEFAILSNSERIKAGLEVANLLMNVSGLYVPIFVDNAESITEIPKMNTQLIEARVEEDSELIVEEVKTFEQELEEVINELEVK